MQVFPGVTCIVGPNGCGKSNVADAVRWALGEQSPKLLRGHKMEDVIFHGTASRKSLGMAEVSLVFQNDGGLAVPWSEVGVARRLYRTGESEYLLNGNACRLRDIQDLFAGTGVNPKAYALMDQERLNHVLTAKPWERRIFIEEAAGIARYKQQRAETQGKLEATRLNLQRVRDVMEEAISIASGAPFMHVSLDMDVLDPDQAPGVGTPVRGGITYREAHLAMEMLATSGKMSSLEVVEVNPVLDERNATGTLAVELVLSAMGARIL